MAGKRGQGEGSLTFDSRDGRWIGRVSLPDGRRAKVSGRTKAEAQARLTQLKREVGDGHMVDGRMTVGDWLEIWAQTILPGRVASKRTIDNYSSVLRNHVVPHLGARRLRVLRVEDVEAMLTVIAERGYGRSTVKRARAVLGQALTEAERRGHIVRSPVALAVLPPTKAPRTRTTFDVAQARALVDAARGDRLEALWLCALYLGLRPGELVGLTWVDVAVDQDPPLLHLRESLQPDGTLGRLKAGAQKRSLQLPAEVADALRRHAACQQMEREQAGDRWRVTFADLGGLVFPSSIGTPVNLSNLRRSFKALRERAGVTGRWVPYSMRHTCVSLLSDAGVPPERIADLLGHNTTRMVLSVYRHAVVPTVDTAATVLDGVLGPRLVRGLVRDDAVHEERPSEESL